MFLCFSFFFWLFYFSVFFLFLFLNLWLFSVSVSTFILFSLSLLRFFFYFVVPLLFPSFCLLCFFYSLGNSCRFKIKKWYNNRCLFWNYSSWLKYTTCKHNWTFGTKVNKISSTKHESKNKRIKNEKIKGGETKKEKLNKEKPKEQKSFSPRSFHWDGGRRKKKTKTEEKEKFLLFVSLLFLYDKVTDFSFL